MMSARLSRLADPLLFIAVGLVSAIDGVRVIVTKRDVVGGIEAGGWVAGLGVLLLIVSCAFALAGAEAAPPERAEVQPSGDAAGAQAGLRLPLIAFALLILYIALLEPLGYVLCTALFMVAYLRLFGRYGPVRIAAISLPFAIASAWLWEAMNMMLPQGPLPWP